MIRKINCIAIEHSPVNPTYEEVRLHAESCRACGNIGYIADINGDAHKCPVCHGIGWVYAKVMVVWLPNGASPAQEKEITKNAMNHG